MSFGEPGERLRSGWCNLYLQGWYHRAGKAGTMTLHPGDLYPTREAAIADIDPDAPYMTTAFVQWEEVGGYETSVYPEGAQPVNLAKTRREWELVEAAKEWRARAEVLVGQSNPDAIDPYRLGQERLIRESGMDMNLSAAYKPSHGGYSGEVRT